MSQVLVGGSTGQESIRNGIFYLYEHRASEEDIVLIHDGVRPLINEETIERNVQTVLEKGNCITTAPVVETIVKAGDTEVVDDIYDRSLCRLARAPQSFYLKDVYENHQRLLSEGDPVMIDTAMMMNHYGCKLHMIPGPVENIKITTPMDYYIFRAIVDAKENSQIWGL